MPFKDPEKSRKYKHNWYVKNQDRLEKANKKWYETHREETLSYKKDWYSRNRDKMLELGKIRYKSVPAEQRQAKERLHRYGLSDCEYKEMLIAQDNKCAICKKPEVSFLRGKPRPLSVDHNHSTNKVRQLLCTRCNSALGYVYEDVNILKEAVAYLIKHNEGQ